MERRYPVGVWTFVSPVFGRVVLACIFMLFTCLASFAQEVRPWEVLLGELSTQEDVESAEWEDTYEMLCDLEQHPIDINSATREELLQLPFLNERQVEDIQAYVHFYGGMKSEGELAMVPSVDYTTRCLLTHFIFCGEQKRADTLRWRNVLKYGHGDLVADASIPFYERRGDKDGYLGYPYRHTVRCSYSYSDRLRVGMLGAQDAGEPFFANKNGAGYDYYSLYAEAHRLGCVQTLVAGRYRASFGMGLVMGNSFSMGKMSVLTSLGSRAGGLRAHIARSPGRYLQGAGATVQLTRGLELSAWGSWRKVDATLRLGADSTKGISSIVTDGYHRTATEMDRKNNVSEGAAGGHLSWRKNGFHVGVTAAFTSYDKPLLPDTSVNYRRYYPMGRRFWNVGADYGYTGPRFILHGETATGDGGAWATINTVAFTPSPQLSLMALHRFYGKRYNAVHANGFSEGGAVRNESGLYAGVSWQAMSHLRVTAYTDYAYFPAAKYQASVSSDAWDNLVQVQYNSDQLSLTARYRLKMRGYDNSEKTALLTKTTHHARLSGTFTQGAWRFGATTDMALAHHEENSRGWLVGCHATYSPRWMKLTGSLAYFNTDDSDSKVYAYEQGLLYAYSYLSFQGKGLRWSLSARADLGKRLTLLAHLATTDYLDRDHISTGYQQIDRSSKTDLALQLKWRF